MAEDGEKAPQTAWAAATRESSGKWKAERSEADYKKRSVAERSGAFAHNLSVSSHPYYAWEWIG